LQRSVEPSIVKKAKQGTGLNDNSFADEAENTPLWMPKSVKAMFFNDMREMIELMSP
jgi:hypothetical protein